MTSDAELHALDVEGTVPCAACDYRCDMSSIRMVAALLPFLAICTAHHGDPDDVTSPFCSDVLTIPRKSLLLAWKLRNTPDLLLDNQRICTAGDLSHPGAARCAWEYELADVALLRPEANTVLRAVSTFRSHLTGTGTWLEFDALECQQSRLVEAFSTGELLYGGQLQQVSSTAFVVTRGRWLKQDAMCCPSHQQQTRYEWDTAAHTYVSKSETYFRVDSTTRKRTRVAKPDNIEQ